MSEEKTSEEIKEGMEEGKLDEDIYTEEGSESLEEGDEISEVEEGFMEGYKEDENAAECATCKKVLGDKFIELEVRGKHYRFCSQKCAEEFR
jgi:hypothetical protein